MAHLDAHDNSLDHSTCPTGLRSASRQALACWITGRRRAELRPEPLPEPGPAEVLVRTRYTAISRGTEALVFRGEVPPSEHQRMRAPFQGGALPWPVKYGYINVGEILAGPEEWLGGACFCLYPHQDLFVVPAEAVLLLPAGIPPSRAVLAANLETAINGLWDASPHLGDHIAVVGAGAVGCLTAWLAGQVPGCRVELIDVRPSRAPVAQTLGVDFASPEEATGDADLVIHASGHPQGLVTALRLAGQEGLVLELSWLGSRPVALPLGEAFHSRRLTVRSSQVGAVAPSQRPRWSTRRRLALALELLQDPVLDCLITGESPFVELPEVLARLADDPGETICHRIAYPQGSRPCTA